MATSSITKNFVISGKEQVETFIEILDKGPAPIRKSKIRKAVTPEKFQEVIAGWKRTVENDRA